MPGKIQIVSKSFTTFAVLEEQGDNYEKNQYYFGIAYCSAWKYIFSRNQY